MTRRRILFDTQLLIWASENRPELPEQARNLLLDDNVVPMFSAASIWEVAIKSALGRPDFQVDPVALAKGLAGAGYIELPISARHAAAVRTLPSPGPGGHKDPFDRLLVAQAWVETVGLATCDAALPDYGENIMAV